MGFLPGTTSSILTSVSSEGSGHSAHGNSFFAGASAFFFFADGAGAGTTTTFPSSSMISTVPPDTCCDASDSRLRFGGFGSFGFERASFLASILARRSCSRASASACSASQASTLMLTLWYPKGQLTSEVFAEGTYESLAQAQDFAFRPISIQASVAKLTLSAQLKPRLKPEW